MGGDNTDRYGYRHRNDSAHKIGESKPGDVGDSDGTFHDRASSDNNVIIDGEAKSYEEHKQNSHSSGRSDTSSSGADLSDLDGEVVEVEVDRISGSGNPIATYSGHHVHVSGGKPGSSYKVKLKANSGYFDGQICERE